MTRTAVVTGGGKGIGRATAILLGSRGLHVLLADVDDEAGAEAAEEINANDGEGRAVFVHADVSVASDTQTLADRASEILGEVDVLVNNAGIQRYGTVADTPEEVWDEVLGVNLKSIYLVSRAVIPLMRDGGAIVNVASVQGFAAQRGVAAYAASKGGAVNLTRSMAVDLAPRIRVNCVCPGSVDTPMLRWAAEEFMDSTEQAMREWAGMHPVGRVAEASEVAEAIAFLASPSASFVTGAVLLVDGGLMSQIPGT